MTLPFRFRRGARATRLLVAPALITAMVLSLPLFMSASRARADAEGDALAWKYHCTTCHGVRGKSNDARYPHIGGQNATYLESRLKYFRAKEEPGNQMNAQAAPLSDEEITRLARHFSEMNR